MGRFLSWLGYKFDSIDDKSLSFSADDAWKQTRYAAKSTDRIVRTTIRDINDFIDYKSKLKGQTKVVYIFPIGYDEVIEQVKEHYIANGYRVKVKQMDSEDGEGTELSVSWYKGEKNGESKISKERKKQGRSSDGKED